MATDLPKISVVTPSYMHGEYIEDTIQSVLGQRYDNLEYIVMDGGSTDRTTDVLRAYDGEISTWVSEPDHGQTDALIKGFALATGDVLCWLNSDDTFEPGALAFIGEYFRTRPETRFVYGDMYWADKDNRFLRPKKEHGFNKFIWLYDHNYFPQPSCFWRHDLYRQVGGLDPRFELAMDADLFIRFAAVTRPAHVRRVLSRMRTYPEQKNQRLRVQSDREDLEIRERLIGSEPVVVKKLKKVAARALRISLKAASRSYLR